MKLVHSIRIGSWLLILLNLMMAFGSIWVFLRMSPVIDDIIKRNTRTLVSCEVMLASLAQMRGDVAKENSHQSAFIQAYDQALENVTEEGEPYQLEIISNNYKKAFTGDTVSLTKTVNAIVRLSDINKYAMVVEDRKAYKLGSAGAWGVVFMSTAVFIVATLLIRAVRRNLIQPVEEIYSVVQANLKGDTMRRCYGTNLSRDVKVLYTGVNDVLDNSSIVNKDAFND